MISSPLYVENRWMNGQIDGWMDRYINGWMDKDEMDE